MSNEGAGRGLFRLLTDALAVGAAARDVVLDRLPQAARSIALYDGFGAAGRVLVMGRALRDTPIAAASAGNSKLENLWAMVRRADADAIPNTAVRVSVGTDSQELITDDEGFFTGWMAGAQPERLDDDWIRVRAELVADQSVRAEARALVPVSMPEFLVISDIDDTVLQSNVTNFLRAVQTMALGNARTRLPFPGVAEFYQALRRGPTGTGRNPMFYVSSSPWNLHDLIAQFLEIHTIPAGPIMLRDMDLGLDTLSQRHHHTHKREMIRRVLAAYPDVPAVLIGDSSQQDAEIYRDVVRQYKGRIKAVYIRNVAKDAERSRVIEQLAHEVVAAGSTLLLADDTLAAAIHAAEHGLIAPDALGVISESKGGA
ncbi:MAG TPA: phosphatase domain-containing protein [Gemmatimonadaceae bacterium]|nr:phosphatase domain-containing protein [Gemmatimonadaceae bacterium]